MNVQDLVWVDELAARDYHLLPNCVSPRFDQLITIKDKRGDRRADNPRPDVKIAFSGFPTLNGVTVDVTTGEVTVAALGPVLISNGLPKSMTLSCVATENSQIAQVRTVEIRIHISVDRAWPSPASLTVRQGAKGVRYSVLAVFGDNEFGDLSNWSPRKSRPLDPGDRRYVRFAGSVEPAIFWGVGPNPTDIGIDTASGFIECTNPAGRANVTPIILSPFPLSAIPLREAVTEGAAPWSGPVPLVPLEGATFDSMDTRRNILILPDGFQLSMEFDRIVGEAVNRLITRLETRPFDLLKDQFNFFTAWVSSPKEDVTVLNEVIIGPSDAFARDAGASSGRRVLLNERNTAFHTAIGYRPTSAPGNETHRITFNPLRLDALDFDAFLTALSDDKGKARGTVWAQGGKDQGLVVIVSRSKRYGATNFPRGTGRVVAMATHPSDIVETVPGSMGAEIVPVDISSTRVTKADRDVVHQRCWLTLAHELAHSFNLIDEYGGRPGPIESDDADAIDASLNTQRRETLLVAGALDSGSVKWDWPRIEKAARYIKLSAQSAGPANRRFTCKLDPAHAARPAPDKFKVGEVVKLRGPGSVLKAPVLSDGLTIISVSVSGAEIVLEMLPGLNPPPPELLPAPPAESPPGHMFKIRVGNIIHPDVGSMIQAKNNPTNAESDPPGRGCSTGSRPVPTPAKNIPAPSPSFKPPEHPYLIVGLYESGAKYTCEVYHPSGSCIMQSEKDAKGQTVVREFCHVCRYVLVDIIDPSQHGQIDRSYKYPG